MFTPFWLYKPDFELRVFVACPQCGGLNHYTKYADKDYCELKCEKCGKNFYREEGKPDPKVEKLVAKIKELTEKANLISRGI